ncbi:ArsR/SmtB family transcription factor [uncultured Flavonifractor sp.]|uniref:ArsR/SmtB family transcription factor n=1 Tax=uncultured Flavonifractor sp. TaxID=1193534 RepID=UPI00262922C2|nr:metalloregulator ArsR/SmtB family transcription factor [uncultured Flavonifractor sp.]
MDVRLREKAQTIAELMAQMANENRLLILCHLLDGPKTVGELGESVPNITGPALSQHLHKLKDGGLVQAEKHGQFVTYSIKDSRLQALMAVLKEQYCAQ